VNMNKPVWVLLYLIDSDAWWPSEKPHNPNYFPDVHTYCFETEKEAEKHRLSLTDPKKYWVHKTYLQVM
jgi:hypothetical protein